MKAILGLAASLVSFTALSATVPAPEQVVQGAHAVRDYVKVHVIGNNPAWPEVELRDYRRDNAGHVTVIEYTARWSVTRDDVRTVDEDDVVVPRTLKCNFSYAYYLEDEAVVEMDGECNG